MSLCESHELASQKGLRKWHGTDSLLWLKFIRLVIEDERFHKALCFGKSQNLTRLDYYDAFIVDTFSEGNCPEVE